jgi:hypothetical protein
MTPRRSLKKGAVQPELERQAVVLPRPVDYCGVYICFRCCSSKGENAIAGRT